MSVIYERPARFIKLLSTGTIQGLQLYDGCPHACRYCNVPVRSRPPRRCSFGPAGALLNILRELEREAVWYRGRPLSLCHVGDPYPSAFKSKRDDITREAIIILKANGILIDVCSKGGTRALRDLDLLGPEDDFGVSLTFIDEADSRYWEPGAASPGDRIEALKAAKKAGVPTSVNLSPVIDTTQSLALLDAVAEHADYFQLNRLEHYPRPEGYDYLSFYKKAKALLDDMGKPYSFLGLNEIRGAEGGPRGSTFAGVKLPKLF